MVLAYWKCKPRIHNFAVTNEIYNLFIISQQTWPLQPRSLATFEKFYNGFLQWDPCSAEFLRQQHQG